MMSVPLPLPLLDTTGIVVFAESDAMVWVVPLSSSVLVLLRMKSEFGLKALPTPEPVSAASVPPWTDVLPE